MTVLFVVSYTGTTYSVPWTSFFRAGTFYVVMWTMGHDGLVIIVTTMRIMDIFLLNHQSFLLLNP